MSCIQFLIKPVSSGCNLNCRYCFYCDEAEKRAVENYGKMELSTAERIIDCAMSDSADNVYFIFQGGEPTLAGVDFYEHFCSYASEHNTDGKKLNFSIQTNCTYRNVMGWTELFAKYDFLVGVSYDGLREIQDYLRPFKDGSGSAKTVLGNVALLQKNNIKFNILTVVTPFVAGKIVRIFERYRKNDWNYLQFIPCLPKIGERENICTLSGREWLDYSLKIFDLWYRENISQLKKGLPMSCSVRHLDDYLSLIVTKTPCTCGAFGMCSVQNVVEADGSVFPCDFYALDSYCMGNINQLTPDQLVRCDNAVKFLSEKAECDECMQCTYRNICTQRCRRYTENGKSFYYPYCIEYYRSTHDRITILAGYFK